ncbi:nitrate reductase subunit alpha [Caballeronia sp. LjRoot29]|uniref:nitrate reductase subunit alpha n=1 Tax=Caballeronia sp. LjRoot29 TaxID=3342315 RepID=UPI003ED06F9E
MSHFLDRLKFVKRTQSTFSNGHGAVVNEDRKWEEGYRNRWQHDKVVRSTHGVNCTGSCSWKVYVKSGLIVWETQQTDYPRTRADLPNHEPRGCPRGASYSWYVYSAQRVKYPMIRGRLMEMWREARQSLDPVAAWASISQDPVKSKRYKSVRGLGGFVRADWNTANEMIAAANAFTIGKFGPDRVIGFSPIPAMSMVSYAAGSRYLSLIGGVCLSFYDWYCDLPPASPQVWGEQTDVPESADWYNSTYLMVWGSNIPQTRTPDAHFYTEVRYKGTKTVAVSSDFGEMVKFGDIWLAPKQGTDAALAMAMGHVVLKEFHAANASNKSAYFRDYIKQYTDMPMLVLLRDNDGMLVPDHFLRASHLADNLDEANNAQWKTLVIDADSGEIVAPNGTIGFRWNEAAHNDGQKVGRWNLEMKDGGSGRAIDPRVSLIDADARDEVVAVGFPYFGSEHNALLERHVPARRVTLADGTSALVATVFDLQMANYGVDQGLGGPNVAQSYDDDVPYTPAWQEKHTTVPRNLVIQVAREFATNAHQTQGKSMVIVGAALNHWYHNDMIYRGIINLLMMCGCVGKSGGGWAHYVGQEKLRPQFGWAPLAFALDWSKPPRQMNGTSFFYNHTSQWRHEKLALDEVLAPTANKANYSNLAMLDLNAKSERMGWLPSAPQLGANPLDLTDEAARAGMKPIDYVVDRLKSGALQFSCDDPDNPVNFPRNMFVWRSNILGSSGKGHEYFLKYLLGTQNALFSDENEAIMPGEVHVREAAEGKLDLLTVLDFRMSTTCLYGDIVLPTATWYEKDDLNTSDMHPFIHPLSEAVQPLWESKSDWEIYKGIAAKFAEIGGEHLGTRTDLVCTPLMHDTPGELGQPFEPKDWRAGECDLIPGKTAPSMTVVERNYKDVYRKFTSVGPLLDTQGNGGKGINWNSAHEVGELANITRTVTEAGVSHGRPRLDSAIDAAEMILTFAPETNGHVAVKAWEALSKITGREHAHLATGREHDKIRFRDVQAQPRKIISAPTWSGLESEEVSYNAGYTNVHELIPWRTLTGRQQFYQDHRWMLDFGEGSCVYRPAIDTKTVTAMLGAKSNGEHELVLNWITPHQKWGIHSTYSDNLRMLTLSRGGPHVWVSEAEAKEAGLVDNDWVEVFNLNGTLTARVVVSQRVPRGMCLMYHAQEKIVNVPGAETSGMRGGIHNSVTRTVLKPTHMIGGYAQQAYGFNYYGTVGSNRDEYVIVRKMKKVAWLEGPLNEGEGAAS